MKLHPTNKLQVDSYEAQLGWIKLQLQISNITVESQHICIKSWKKLQIDIHQRTEAKSNDL